MAGIARQAALRGQPSPRIRALPADSFVYFGDTAVGKTALPGRVDVAGAAGRPAGIVVGGVAGAAAASVPH
jgi:hypothetical protein